MVEVCPHRVVMAPKRCFNHLLMFELPRALNVILGSCLSWNLGLGLYVILKLVIDHIHVELTLTIVDSIVTPKRLTCVS